MRVARISTGALNQPTHPRCDTVRHAWRTWLERNSAAPLEGCRQANAGKRCFVRNFATLRSVACALSADAVATSQCEAGVPTTMPCSLDAP